MLYIIMLMILLLLKFHNFKLVFPVRINIKTVKIQIKLYDVIKKWYLPVIRNFSLSMTF